MLLQMALFHFLWLGSTPLYICTMSLSIQLLIDIYLGCFHVLAIVNRSTSF